MRLPAIALPGSIRPGSTPERPITTPLRVCYLVSYFHPFASGAERQAMAQGAELVRRGHAVHVLTRAVAGYHIPDEEVEGVSIHRWIRPVEKGPLFGLTFVTEAIRALRRLRPRYDVVHTHQALWEAVATGLGRRCLGGLPTLVQPASSGYYGEAQELLRTRGRTVLRRAILSNTAFAAISAEIEREWQALGVPAGTIQRTASGVDTSRFRPGASSLEADLLPRPRVLFTGRLHPQKNLDVLLDAWPEVARRSSANLILAGPGPERARLEEKAKALGVADRVQFTGPVPDVAETLRAADVFALPSVAEGMSNSLLEAMATGLACAASGIGGNTDLLDHGTTGLLVSSPEPEAWSSAILRLIDDPPAAQVLGDAARRVVEQTFALGVVVDRYVALYQALLSGTWPEHARSRVRP